MITEYIPVAYRRSVALPRVIDPGNIWDVVEWCRAYGPDQGQRPLLRYAIGLYQIASMSRWKGTMASAESAAAFALHVISAAEMVVPSELSVSQFFSASRWDELSTWIKYDASVLLTSIAILQQQYCYITTCVPGTIRYSRIDPKIIAMVTANAVSAVMMTQRPWQRAAGVETAMQMLLDLEWARKEKTR